MCGLVLVYSGWNALQQGVLINISKEMRIQDISSVPIAIPMIAGPGTITAVVTFPAQYGTLITVAAIFAALAVNFLIMFFAKNIGRVLVKINVMSALVRIIGLIIATIGIQMVFDGITGYMKIHETIH
jgi:multiple antibiotic resistance protein